MSRDRLARAEIVEHHNDESACGTGVSFNLDKCRCRFFAHFSHRWKAPSVVDAKRALHALTLLRQHFLKRDAVFLSVLVYSGCSAFRFPSARSDQVVSPIVGDPTNSEGNMAKKAKKAKKAKSAVKKTAKKTKKVSKKKK
jgi:hypothetical protein